MSAEIHSPLQEAILTIVGQYPGQFSRTGLAQMLVGAKSWQATDYPAYGRFASYRRRDVAYQIEILEQQGYLEVNTHNYLIPASSSSRKD